MRPYRIGRCRGAVHCARDCYPVILVAQDLGPTDLADVELAGLVIGGIALAEGSVTSHAAIVARSLGVPLVVGLGEQVLGLS